MIARSSRFLDDHLENWRRTARRRLRASEDDLLFIAGVLIILAVVAAILLIIWLFAKWGLLAACASLMFLGPKYIEENW